MEKIRSGQSFLYREGGLNSTVIDVRMKTGVRGDILQQALRTSLERYPYLGSKLVEKNGDFYLEECHNSMTVNRTEKYRVLGSMATGYHLIDITYIGRSIRVAFHHALCDGRGIQPFVETLIYYYCCLRFHKQFDATGIRLATDPLLPGETQEPIGNALYEVDESKLPQVVKDGYAMPENTQAGERFYRYEINIDRKRFIDYMKANGATPGILLALLVSGSIYSVHPDADKPIVCSMAMDYRREIGLEHTHKNCVASLYLPYTEEIRSLSLPEQAAGYRATVKAQRVPDAMKAAINAQIGLCHKLDQLDSLQAKRQALAFFNDMCINTYVISYLGQVELGGCAEHVESIHLYNSGVNGLRINMICAGDYFTVDVLHNYESEDFVHALLHALDETGISYTAAGRIPFETTKDKAFLTAGRQAERYYRLA